MDNALKYGTNIHNRLINCTFTPIPGFPQYKINQWGDIYSTKTELFRRPYRHNSRSNQYLRLALYSNGRAYKYFVHELVALTFIGPKPYGKQVNHLDLNTMNNHVSNLEYVTDAQNKAHYRAATRRNGILGA